MEFATDLGNGVCTRLSPGSRPDPEDGVSDGHAVFSAEGVEQGHGDAEEGHAEHSAASPTPQAPHQADSVHGRPGDLQRTQTFRGKCTITSSNSDFDIRIRSIQSDYFGKI